MKNRQDMTDHTGVMSIEYDTKLSRSIKHVGFMMKTRQDNDVTDHTCLLNVENKTELSYPI